MANPRSPHVAAAASEPAGKTPDWDLSRYFPELDGAEYRAFRDALQGDMPRLRSRAEALPPLESDEARSTWRELLLALEDASARLGHLASYLSCMTAADAANEIARREEGALERIGAAFEKAFIALRAALEATSDAQFDALVAHEQLAPVRYFLTRMRIRAARTMGVALEGLATDLGLDGIEAWGRLYDRISGSLTFELAVAGRETRTLPVSMTRSLLEDADPAVRAAALRGSSRAWQSASESLATGINAIAGTRLTLYARRGFAHFLDAPLFEAGIERATLDALWSAVRARQDVARRYLRHKAALLGLPALGFQDLMAPLPSKGETRIPWESATNLVRAAFGASYPRLRGLADRALAQRWIDYRPRMHKRPGGFCTSSSLLGESRVFLTYNGAMGDVQTLAHELGHAFHNSLMVDLRPWQRRYPMTLAETASTFAEQLVTDAALANPQTSDAERARLLDRRLQDASTFLLNIPMRFDFEHALYTRRAEREQSVRELGELMAQAQRQNYGDALDPDQLDPWFWASKLHFHMTRVSFYNFPYTFGYLFSLGIFARAKREGEAFLPRYEELLRRTGSAPAEQVAHDALGVDLRSADFWNASIDGIAVDLAQFERIAPV